MHLSFFVVIQVRLLLLTATARLVKWLLNLLFRQGRPFWLSSDVLMLHCPATYGSPSGHTLLWFVCIWPLSEYMTSEIIRSWREFRTLREDCAVAKSSSLKSARAAYVSNCSYKMICVGVTRLCLVVLLAAFYMAMLFSRLALGTHLPYDLIYGIGAGGLIVAIGSTHNVRALSDMLGRLPGRTCCMTWLVLLKLIAFAFVLLGIIEAVTWGFHDGPRVQPDPDSWTSRAKEGGCR
jgi:membrane-associated phospholipid phosphatase